MVISKISLKISKNLIKVSLGKLNNYIHIGSDNEFKEFKYWENYFLNDTK